MFNQDGDLERCALRPGNVHSAHGWRDVLAPVVARYRGQGLRRLLRGDAAFALPDVYEYLEAEGFQYTIRLPANHVLQAQIAHRLTRPVGRPPHYVRRLLRDDAAFALPDVYEYLEAEGFQYVIRLPANQVLQAQIAPLLTRPVGRPAHYVRRFYASFRYQAQSWTRPRRVVAKVEWHPGELYPRVGFIVTNLHRPAKKVVAFYNGRGTAEQWIKEGKNAVKWTRLSCTSFRGNAV